MANGRPPFATGHSPFTGARPSPGGERPAASGDPPFAIRHGPFAQVYLPCHSSFTSMHLVLMNSLMSSTTWPCRNPKVLSAAVIGQSAVLARVGASILPQFMLALTALPPLKVILGWICKLTSYLL